jgi:hypothetical protein
MRAGTTLNLIFTENEKILGTESRSTSRWTTSRVRESNGVCMWKCPFVIAIAACIRADSVWLLVSRAIRGNEMCFYGFLLLLMLFILLRQFPRTLISTNISGLTNIFLYRVCEIFLHRIFHLTHKCGLLSAKCFAHNFQHHDGIFFRGSLYECGGRWLEHWIYVVEF